MSAAFVQLLAATSSGATPAPPTAANLTTYGGSLVQVNWTNANSGTKQTRVYRKTRAGGWSLRTTAAAGAINYATGDSSANNYIYGVSHFDPATGLESEILSATDLPPNPPTGVTAYTYSGTKLGVSWTNAESLPVRCYRNGGLVITQPTGTAAWDSGYTSGTLGVSHYDSTTGQESSIVTPGGA